MKNETVEMLLWDWNGTLLDDGEYGVGIINAMLRRRGLPEREREEHARIFDFPVRRYYERLGFDFVREPFEVLSHEFVKTYYAGVDACPLRTGAEALLRLCQSNGLRQWVLSATHETYLMELVHRAGVRSYFEDLLGIDSVHAPGKVDRGLRFLEEGKLDPAKVLLIGDTVHDAEVAEAMGIRCWLLEGGHHDPERLRATERPIFSSLGEIQKALPEVTWRGCFAS